MKWSLTYAAMMGFASAAAGQTFIVDAANGPGTNFTEIATAVAAVPDGAVLQVRAGSYAAFTIASKGLSVVCDTGVTVGSSVFVAPVTVSGTLPQQTVELRGLQMPWNLLWLTGCQGPLLLYNCTIGNYSQVTSLHATSCAQLQAEGCAFGGLPDGQTAMVLDHSVAVLRNCNAASSIEAIDVWSSSAQLTDCRLATGGLVFNTPAILMTNGDVRVIGGSLSALFSPSIGGTGIARADPSVIASPSGLFTTNVLGSIVEMPAVIATGGSLGTTATVTMRGPTNSVAALLAGQPGPPLAIPGIADPSWLQPGTEILCQFSGVPLQIQRSVPNLPSLRGLRVAWQGFTYDAITGLQASSPAETTVW